MGYLIQAVPLVPVHIARRRKRADMRGAARKAAVHKDFAVRKDFAQGIPAQGGIREAHKDSAARKRALVHSSRRGRLAAHRGFADTYSAADMWDFVRAAAHTAWADMGALAQWREPGYKPVLAALSMYKRESRARRSARPRRLFQCEC